jgi:hypothetical protein
MEGVIALATAIPLLGINSTLNDLAPETLPNNFRTTWDEEEVGIKTKLVFKENFVGVLPALNIWRSTGLLFLVQSLFCILLGAVNPTAGVGFAAICVVFLVNYANSLRRELHNLPFFITREPIALGRNIPINSISGLVVRENSKRRDDPHLVQIYLLLDDDQMHRLIHQDYFYRRLDIVRKAVLLHEWLKTKNDRHSE